MGVRGKINVIATMDNVVIKRYLPGLLLIKGFLLLITRTIREAEIPPLEFIRKTYRHNSKLKRKVKEKHDFEN